MNNVDIIVPSVKPVLLLRPQLTAMERARMLSGTIIPACSPQCAAKNRNEGLALATTDVVIFVDDDIEGFFPGWDAALVSPFALYPHLCIVSARLLAPEGTPAHMCSDNYDLLAPLVFLGPNASGRRDVPFSAVAMRRLSGLRFDELYRGSGWEDSDMVQQYLSRDSQATIAITNLCKLIHRNEKKNQVVYFGMNQRYFEDKWPHAL